MRSTLTCSILLGAMGFASVAMGAAFDGSQPLICSTVEVLSCEPGLKCQQETAEIVDIPHFLKISFAEKTVSGVRPSGAPADAKIDLIRLTEKKLFLQGVQKQFGWTMGIDEASGRMTMVINDDRTGYVVFGACTLR